MFNGFKKLVRKTVYKLLPPPFTRNSYSQSGEDVIVDFLFRGIGLSRPAYLDIGTNNPTWGNNTFLFYENGSRGVLVEADETIIPLIRAHRTGDKILNIGVGLSEQKEADFYIFDVSGIHTFNKEEAEERNRVGVHKIVKVAKVPLKPINDIIKENFDSYPDFLSIDIEGLDLAVLQSLDFSKYPIPVICSETCTYSENHIKPKDPAIAGFMATQGYFIYADTYINTIFVNKNWFYNSKIS